MKKSNLVVLVIMLLISMNAHSQLGVTAYSIYALGVNTSQNHRISGELKVFTNRTYKELLTELDGFYNFKSREYHRFSVGLGLNVGPFKDYDNFYAITIPAAIEIFPLKEFKKISILFELAPEIRPGEDLNIRFMWGIRYSFD